MNKSHETKFNNALDILGFEQTDKDFIKIGCNYLKTDPSLKRLRDIKQHFNFRKKVSLFFEVIETIYLKNPITSGKVSCLNIITTSAEILIIKKANDKLQKAQILNNPKQRQGR